MVSITLQEAQANLAPVIQLSFRQWMDKALADLKLWLFAITVEQAERLIVLPSHHGDPFDRLIAAQVLVEKLPLVRVEPIFDTYEVIRVRCRKSVDGIVTSGKTLRRLNEPHPFFSRRASTQPGALANANGK